MNFRNVIGGIPGLIEEIGFEMENPISSVIEAFSDSTQDVTREKFPSKGTLEFNQNQAKLEEELKKRKEADRRKDFYRNLEDQKRAQEAKDRMLFEEEINDITVNLSTEEKNRLLHYQASYKDKSIYQIAALRKKIIEERKKADNQEKTASIPSPAKQANALESAFEGGSGKQGSGTANLSAQATG